MKLTFMDFRNDELERQAGRAFESARSLLPSWVCEVIIQMVLAKEGDDDCIQIFMRPEYRWVRIEIFPRFFSENAEDQAEYMSHEMMHAVLGPLTKFVDDVLIAPVEEKNPDLFKVLTSNHRTITESVIQEWVYAHQHWLLKEDE